MRFESQTHLQDDHVDRITDCSTRYGHASMPGQGKMRFSNIKPTETTLFNLDKSNR